MLETYIIQCLGLQIVKVREFFKHIPEFSSYTYIKENNEHAIIHTPKV